MTTIENKRETFHAFLLSASLPLSDPSAFALFLEPVSSDSRNGRSGVARNPLESNAKKKAHQVGGLCHRSPECLASVQSTHDAPGSHLMSLVIAPGDGLYGSIQLLPVGRQLAKKLYGSGRS